MKNVKFPEMQAMKTMLQPIMKASAQPTEQFFPIGGEQGQKIIKSLNNYIKRLLPQNHTSQHVYKSRKLGSEFDTKDKKKLEHKHDH